MANFSFADVYGSAYGFATTRLQTVPDEGDQEALVDDTTANADIHTDPKAKRNIMLFVVAALALIVLFSIG